MKTVTLDIETIAPRYQGDPDSFPGIPYHEPCAIYWLTTQPGEPELVLRGGPVTGGAAESALLADLARDLRGAEKLITFNGRGFDLPVLTVRAVKHGVAWGHHVDRAPGYEGERRARFSHWKDRDRTPWHFDLMDQVGDYGAARGISLGALAQAWGLPGKIGIDGSMVGEMWARGEVEEVCRYCAHDVLTIWLCFVKYSSALHDERIGKLIKPTIEWARGNFLLAPIIEERYGEVC